MSDRAADRTDASHDPGMIAERLVELGIELPPVFPPAGNYLGCVVGLAELLFDITVEIERIARLRA